MALRIARLTPGFRRALSALAIPAGSARRLALAGAITALSDAEVLPGPADLETDFRPGRAHARRLPGHNLWLLYRFGEDHVDVLAVRKEPPVPTGEG